MGRMYKIPTIFNKIPDNLLNLESKTKVRKEIKKIFKIKKMWEGMDTIKDT